VITLRRPEDESAGAGEVVQKVAAGGQAMLFGLVRNQSGIVDNYDLRLKGLPPEWWTITPSTVYLVPFGAAPSGYEQEVEIRFHPPRAPEAEARSWPIMVAAASRATGDETGSGRAALEIEPFLEIESELRPERAGGRRYAGFALAVRNKGNTPADVAVVATDPDNAIRFDWDQQELKVGPGKREPTTFKARPPKQIIFGRPLDRRFQVDARVPGTDVAAFPRQGIMRQKPWFPWWLLPAILMIGAALAAILLLLPKSTPKTIVPDLKQATSTFEVQKMLKEAGLEVGNVAEEKTADAKPGTVLDQTPAAGEKVDKGTKVDLKVAVGTGTVKVPDLAGLTVTAADKKLRKKKLTLGQVTPTPTDPDTQIVKTQVPEAGIKAQEGSAVNVFLEVPPGTTAAPPGATTGKNGGEGGITDLPGLPGPAAVTVLKRAGLSPAEVHEFSPDVKEGNVIRTDPEKLDGLPAGTKVTLFISAGFPDIAFDFGGNVFVMAGATGKPANPIAGTDDVEEQPSWSPDASLIAYRRGSGDQARIWLVNPEKPKSAHPLTEKGFDDRRPAFSPNGKVIAFVRSAPGGSDYDLCFIRVDSPSGKPRCIADPDHNVSRPGWAPDGKAILVVSSDPGNAQQVELLEYTSGNASSAKPPDWTSLGLVTDAMHGNQAGEQVLSAAWSPDGAQVAFTANWKTGVVRLFLAPAKDDKLDKGKPVEAVAGCEVSWRSDSGELALTRRDARCDQPGTIIRVDPANPEAQVVLTKSGASNPAWNPLPPGR